MTFPTRSRQAYDTFQLSLRLAFVAMVLLLGQASIRAQNANVNTNIDTAATTPQSVATAKSNDDLSGIKYWGLLVSMVSGICAILLIIFTKTVPWARTKIDSYRVSITLGKDFPKENIEKSIKYYIQPLCQDIDPSGGEESRALVPVQANLFDSLQRFVQHDTDYRYMILLADSGMGKTSALIKLCLHYKRFWRSPLHLRRELMLIALGNPNAIESIKQVQDKASTVLLLDAFDEDTQAVADHTSRLDQIMEASREFPCVLISCRTQFFPKDEEIPVETGILKFGPRAAGDSAQHKFHKLYLSPFNDEQAKKYINRRFRISPFRRRRALTMAAKIPHLTARPMLLAHIDDLVRTERDIRYSFELYEEMINAWAEREEPWVKKNELLEFSSRLAADLYLNSSARKAERISRTELAAVAAQWKIPLDEWKIRTRSLLNRDAEGNYKFAHRSIMEYLLVKRFLSGDESFVDKKWTDQMQIFLWEMALAAYEKDTLPTLLLGENWNNYNTNQKNSRCLLLGQAALVGLQRTNLPQTLESYQNLCKLIIQLFMLMLSPSSFGYPSRPLIKPASNSSESFDPSDIRVTLFDAATFSLADPASGILATESRQELDDFPAPPWQANHPGFPSQGLEEGSLMVADGKPSAAYMSGAATYVTKYVLAVESSNPREVELFFNTYASLGIEILQSLPERPQKAAAT